MSIRTLFLYLIGNRQAILTLSSDRRALWVGLLFVLSAGFAREYDARSLLHEPWFFLIPLVASLISSFVLFHLLFSGVWRRQSEGLRRPQYLFAYARFLTLFWMTAPLAWLYAIPYERFLTLSGATFANLITLAVVAVWRVVLMVRTTSVLMGYDTASAFFRVMLFADVIALVAGLANNFVTHGPLFFVMAGMRLPQSDPLIDSIGFWFFWAAILLIPVWFLGVWRTSGKSKPVWQGPCSPADLPTTSGSGMWVLGASSLAVWMLILPWSQPEQMLRCRVEQELKAGRIAEALDIMSAHEPTDFPPYWEPPLIISSVHFKPHIIDVIPVIIEKPPALWVREQILRKFGEHLGYYGLRSPRINGDEEIAHFLFQLPEGPALAVEHQDRIRETLQYVTLSPEDKARLEKLLNEAEGRKP